MLDSNTSLSDSGEFGIGDNPEWDSGNYKYVVVKGQVSINALVVIGEAHLILTDGCKLTCTGGVNLEKGNTLNIYGQSADGLGASEGQLLAVNTEKSNAAGIGSRGNSNNYDAGDLYIHGGNITAKGNKNAAGIGGGNNGSGGKVVIYCGTVSATGGEDGAGIGGGWANKALLSSDKGDGGLVTINGGEVTAQGGSDAAGIGSGGNCSGCSNTSVYGTLIVNGGKVSATGGYRGAGIGSGNAPGNGPKGKCEINGGEVIAQGGFRSAGIGAGNGGYVHHVVINNGTVNATGGPGGYGIGGYKDACDSPSALSSNIEIKGGKVTAKGGAEFSDGVKITSGGIGHAWGMYFTGGTITVISQCEAAIIFSGGNRMRLGDGLRVSNGDSEDALVLAEAGQRVNACKASKRVAKLEPCSDHSEINADTYIYLGIENHTVRCKYCNHTVTEAHTFENDVCTKCGGSKATVNYGVTLNRPSAINITSYDKGDLYTVGSGKNFTLPEGPEVNGLVFMGWDETQPTGTFPYLLADNITPAHQPGYVVENVTTAKTFYARYIKSTSEEWTWDTSTDTPTAKVAVTMGGTTTAYGATVTLKEQQAATAEADGYKTYTATYSKADEGRTYTFTNEMRVPVPYVYDMALANETDNAEKITTHDKRLANVTLTGHTLYKDDHWNTLCLPFDVTTASGPLSGDGVSAKVLDGTTSSLTGGTLTLNFTNVASDDVIPAGTPFIIKWTGGSDIVGPVFENVLVQSDLNSETFQGGTFEGSYVPFAITSENIDQIAYLGAGDVLGYATEARTLKAFRAHFVLPTTVSGSRAMTRAIINYGDGTTAIVSLRDGITERVGSAPEGWYDLQGRRLEGRPQAKGIYIRDGKKVVIK